MTLTNALQNRIKELCKDRNITPRKLCILSGVSETSINNLFNGMHKSIRLATIERLCDGLGISIADFFRSDLFRGLDSE